MPNQGVEVALILEPASNREINRGFAPTQAQLLQTESVADWIEAGRRGERPVTPAAGYAWKETPRLNADIVRKARRESLKSVRNRLERGYARVVATIDRLDDDELLDVGAFEWAGRYPIARWISLNTARQYTTARSFIRKALREAG